MKFFALILSVWLIVIALLPCGDHEDTRMQPSVSAQSTNHQQAHHTEHCTPLCSCSCCSISFSHHALLPELGMAVLAQSKQHTYYACSFYEKTANAIWQPPKAC
ncbi:DUF6660 family protein [Niabella insulamsoli]|uniref:DUF6660 family protein n=1 Tax=Niabella insulamsoli TaxID=3144874 RepID=UPI003CCC579C